MNILITVHSYYPNKDGVQFVTQYLAEGLVASGNKVCVITNKYKDRTVVDYEEINGVYIIRWDAYTKYTFHKGDKKGYQKYILEHQNEFDVMVNVGTQTALTDWLLPIYKQIIIPKFLYIHSIWDFKIYPSDKSSISRFIAKIWANLRWSIYFRRYKNSFKSYDIVSQLHEKDYSYKYFERKYGIKSRIIENAVDDQFFNYGEVKKVKSYTERPYAIYVANYIPGKDQMRCIENFYSSKIPSNWKLVLIGSTRTEYYYKLLEYEKDIREKLGISESRVEFKVEIEREEIYKEVANASIFLMTSRREAFPISIIEAIAAGVPFISTDVGIVKNIPGGKVVSDNVEFQSVFSKLANNLEECRELGAIGREYAMEHCKKSEKIRQFEEMLKEIKRC